MARMPVRKRRESFVGDTRIGKILPTPHGSRLAPLGSVPRSLLVMAGGALIVSYVAASGTKAAGLAGRIGDGLIMSESDPEVVRRREQKTCWRPSRRRAGRRVGAELAVSIRIRSR